MDSEDEKVAEATILQLTKALADIEEQLLILAKNTKQLEDHVAAHPDRSVGNVAVMQRLTRHSLFCATLRHVARAAT